MLLVLAAQQFSTLVTSALIALLQDDGSGPAHGQKGTHEELPCPQQRVPEAPSRLLPGLLPWDASLSAERAPHSVPAEPVFLAGWPQPQQIAPDRGLL